VIQIRSPQTALKVMKNTPMSSLISQLNPTQKEIISIQFQLKCLNLQQFQISVRVTVVEGVMLPCL
jgi:hypothetical protein